MHAFALHPEQVHDVGLGQHVVEIADELHTPPLHLGWQQGGGCHDADPCTEQRERLHLAAGDPGVEQVTHDDHVPTVEIPEVAAHGEHVEQRLGGVLVPAVPGVEDGDVEVAGELAGCTGTAGAHHHAVHAHRIEGQCGVLEGLALGHRGALGGEVQDLGGQSLGREVEADAGPGGVLQEEVAHHLAPQGRDGVALPGGDGQELLGGVEDPHHLGGVEVVDTEQVRHGRRVRAVDGILRPGGPVRRRVDARTHRVTSASAAPATAVIGPALRRRARRARRPRRRAPPPAPGCDRRRRWAGSCPRGPRGSAAPGDHGRPG